MKLKQEAVKINSLTKKYHKIETQNAKLTKQVEQTTVKKPNQSQNYSDMVSV